MVRRALIAALATLGLAPAAAQAADPGLSVLGFTNPDRDSSGQHIEPQWTAEALQAAPAGKKWVYFPIDWSQFEPTQGHDWTQPPTTGMLGDLDARVAAYNAAGINIMAVITTAPDWAHPGETGPNHAPAGEGVNAYANFAAKLATRYAGKVQAWQIWNEPNDKIFWIGGPQPERYAGLLKTAYPAVKAADPAATVVTGGLVHNDYDFVEALYANGAGDSFDAVGTHMSTACLTRSPHFYERDQDTGRIGKYYFTGYREVRQQLAKHGHDKPIFMEIGWSTSDKPCNVPGKSGPAGVSQAQQAQFLTEAYQCLANDPYVRAAAWFNLQDARATDESYDYRMGLIGWDGGRKPSWAAMQQVAAGVGAAPCGGKVDVDAPTATIDVPSTYFTRMVVRGSASDPTTPIKKIELWVDGKRVEGANAEGASYEKDWFGSTQLSYGKHTVELRAYDEALNVAKAAAVVERIDPAKAPRTVMPRLEFSAKRKKGRRIRVSVRVRGAAEGDFRETPKGRVQIVFQRKSKGRWKKYSRYTKGISKRTTFTYKARRKGRWRVFARVALDAPYKNIRSKRYTFKF